MCRHSLLCASLLVGSVANRQVPMNRTHARTYLPFLACVAWLVIVKLAILGGPPDFRSPAQAAVFAWPFLAMVTAAGYGGVWLSRRVGIPDLWDARVRGRDRFLVPVIVGLALGLALLGTDLGFGWTRTVALAHGLPSIHIPFPASALIYPGGAIIVCVIYYLVPIPLLAWLISRVMGRGRNQAYAFWIAGLLCAAIEPLTQDLTPSMRALGLVGAVVFVIDYAANLAQVVAFRNAGFLAAVVLRIAFYMVWHIVPSLSLR